MSYRDLVTIETDISLDTSELNEALDNIRERLENVAGLDEDRVRDLVNEETSTALADVVDRLSVLEAKMFQVSSIRLALSQIVNALSEVGA